MTLESEGEKHSIVIEVKRGKVLKKRAFKIEDVNSL
jgi:hypothetical protein